MEKNSGNLIFSSGQREKEQLRRTCEQLIRQAFGVEIPVALLDGQELAQAMAHAPGWWGVDGDAKHNAIFVIPPATPGEIQRQVGEIKPDYERVDSYGQVIFWSAPRKTFSRTSWSKISGTAVYNSVTIRNANTARKLAELAAD